METAMTTTYQLLDGTRSSEETYLEIATAAAKVKAARGRAPHLAAILVGDDGASRTYVEAKVKACEEVGFRSSLIRLPETIAEDELLDRISGLNYHCLHTSIRSVSHSPSMRKRTWMAFTR